MSETTQALAWVVSECHADSTLTAAAVGGIWETFADIGTPGPYVQLVPQDGTDVLTMQAVRLFTHILLQIKGIGPTSSYASLGTIAERIDALFKDRRNIALTSGGVLSCYREQEIVYGELVNGKAWTHLGGLYHIDLQGS